MIPQKNQYSSYIQIKHNNIPRIMWINKNWSLQRVHLEVFKFYRHYFTRYYTVDTLISPFKISTRDKWESLTDEEAFSVAFSELNAENWKDFLMKNDLDIS
jgi:hypothetical protein